MAYIPLINVHREFGFAGNCPRPSICARSLQLLWAIGLLCTVSVPSPSFWWNVYGHYDVMYRLWYLIGAILVPLTWTGHAYLLSDAERQTYNALLGAATVYATSSIYYKHRPSGGLTSLTVLECSC